MNSKNISVRIVGLDQNNNAFTNICCKMILSETYEQNCQDGLGRYRHDWVKDGFSVTHPCLESIKKILSTPQS